MKSKNLPELQFHTKMIDFYKDFRIPMWNKLIHFFIVNDARSTGKNGWTIWFQNPGLIKRFRIYDEITHEVVWEPSLSSIQKSIHKLEEMGFIVRKVNPITKKREIRLNRAMLIEFLRQNSMDTDLYKGLAPRSRERKLIRSKIITVCDYINGRKRAQNEQFQAYLNYQAKKYGYDITVPDVDIFNIDLDVDLFITRAELEFYVEAKETHKVLDSFYERIRTF